jgi:hypothetical protein
MADPERQSYCKGSRRPRTRRDNTYPAVRSRPEIFKATQHVLLE